MANNNDGMRRMLQTATALPGSAEGTHAAQQMPTEDRQWLQDAMDNTAAAGGRAFVDPSKKLRDAVGKLKTGNCTSLEEMRDLLADIMEYTEFLDLAVDFHKMGGFDVLRYSASNNDVECRRLSAEILGQVLQHNPYCQQKAIAEDMFSTIYGLLGDENQDVSRKGLLALSALVRSCAPAQDLFLKNHGFRHICEANSKHSPNDERFETKVAFLLSCMSSESPAAAEKLISMGLYPYAFERLEKPHNQSHEYWLSTVTDLVRLHPNSMEPDDASKYIKLLMFKLDAEYKEPEHHEAKEHGTVLSNTLKEQLAALDSEPDTGAQRQNGVSLVTRTVRR